MPPNAVGNFADSSALNGETEKCTCEINHYNFLFTVIWKNICTFVSLIKLQTNEKESN